MLFLAIFAVLFLHNATGFGASVSNQSELIEKSAPQKHADISVGSNHLFGLTPESEFSVSGLDTFTSIFNKNFVNFCLPVDASASLHLVQFKYFTSFYNNCLIHSRKSDLIFPFHYFW